MLQEDLEHAKRIGANIYAEFLGGSFTSDAYHMTKPHPEGVVLCIEKVLAPVISHLKDTPKFSPPLVVFGHMHKELAHGNRHRKTIVVGEDNTTYLWWAILKARALTIFLFIIYPHVFNFLKFSFK